MTTHIDGAQPQPDFTDLSGRAEVRADAEVRFVFSRNRHPSGRRAVHLVIAAADRALCGVLAGDEADGMPMTCMTCRAAAEQSGLDTGPQRVRIRVGATEARILAAYDRDLVRTIRAVARDAGWDPESKSWAIAAADAAEVGDALARAGFTVATTSDGPDGPGVIAGFEVPEGLGLSRSLTRAGARDAAGGFTVTDAPGERTGPPGKWHVHCGLASRLVAADAPYAGPTACGRFLPAPAETAAEAAPVADVCLPCRQSVRAGWRGIPLDWAAIYAANADAAYHYPDGPTPERQAACHLLAELCEMYASPALSAADVAADLADGREVGYLWLDMSQETLAALADGAQIADAGDLAAWLGCLKPAGQGELAAVLVSLGLEGIAADPALGTAFVTRGADLLTDALRLRLLGTREAPRAAAADLAAEREELARSQHSLPETERVPDAIMEAVARSTRGCVSAAHVARRLDDPDLASGIYRHLHRLIPGPLAGYGIASDRDLASWIAEARRRPGDGTTSLEQALAALAQTDTSSCQGNPEEGNG